MVDLVTDEPLNIDVTGNLGTMNIMVLLTELVKVPLVRRQVAKLLHFQEGTIEKRPVVNQTDEGEYVPIILSNMLPTENKNPTHKPFLFPYALVIWFCIIACLTQEHQLMLFL